MDDNQKRDQNNNNKNKKNFNGLLILLAWATVLTIAFNYLSAYSSEAAAVATTHEIKYSEFLELVEDDKVAEVVFTEGRLEIT